MVSPWRQLAQLTTRHMTLASSLPHVPQTNTGLLFSPLPLPKCSLHQLQRHHQTLRPHPLGSVHVRQYRSIANCVPTGGGVASSFRPSTKCGVWLCCGRGSRVCCHGNVRSLAMEAGPPNSLSVHVTEFDASGSYKSKVLKKSEVLFQHGIQPRDIRFSTLSSLFVRGSSIILRLQHIKAIINADSVVLLDSDHRAIKEFLPELQQKITTSNEDLLPFEFTVLEAMLMKVFSVLDDRLNELEPALREVLNSLLDPRLFSVDRGELHILLHHSKSLSEFHSIVKDIEDTLTDVLDNEEDMADMYLTHVATTGEDRDPDEIEEMNNILEAYLMQAENMLSEVQKLRDLIDQSESIILINLDSQRNVMMRLSLQLEMGVFSATLAGLIGMAFGMNLDSSLEENPYAFWVTTGCMVMLCGLIWRRLLLFLGTSLSRGPLKRLQTPPKKQRTPK